jgi:hypothetical protein
MYSIQDKYYRSRFLFLSMIYDLFAFSQASHPGLPAGFVVEWYLAMCCRTKRMVNLMPRC